MIKIVVMENKYSKTPLSRLEILKAIAFKNVMERKKEKTELPTAVCFKWQVCDNTKTKL